MVKQAGSKGGGNEERTDAGRRRYDEDEREVPEKKAGKYLSKRERCAAAAVSSCAHLGVQVGTSTFR